MARHDIVMLSIVNMRLIISSSCAHEVGVPKVSFLMRLMLDSPSFSRVSSVHRNRSMKEIQYVIFDYASLTSFLCFPLSSKTSSHAAARSPTSASVHSVRIQLTLQLFNIFDDHAQRAYWESRSSKSTLIQSIIQYMSIDALQVIIHWDRRCY